MPVAPAGGYGNNGGFFGGDWAWILLLLLIGGNGLGFGGGFGGNMMWPMMMGGMNAGMEYLYPWLNNSQNMNGGFRDQMLQDNITSIRDGVQGLATQLCNSFGQAEIAANNRQMADMQQNFALQSAMQN